MRVAGDVQACRTASRELLGAAAAVSGASADLRAATALAGGWTGAAAGAWQASVAAQSGCAESRCDGLSAAGRLLAAFADDLELLQARARGLAGEAAATGLHLDEVGHIAPVVVAVDPHLAAGAVRQQQAREDLLEQVQRLREDERQLREELGDRLRALLRQLAAEPLVRRPAPAPRPVPEASAWLPNRYDLPSLVLSAGDGVGRVTSRLPPLVGRAAGSSSVGGVVTAGTEVLQGRDWDDAVTKGAVTGAATGGAVWAAGALPAAAVSLGVLTAPVSVPVLVGAGVLVGVGAGAGYVSGRLFDAHGHHLPWVEEPEARKRRRRRRRR